MIAKNGFTKDCPVHGVTQVFYGEVESSGSFSSSDECTCGYRVESSGLSGSDRHLEESKDDEVWAPLNRKDRRSKRGKEYLKNKGLFGL